MGLLHSPATLWCCLIGAAAALPGSPGPGSRASKSCCVDQGLTGDAVTLTPGWSNASARRSMEVRQLFKSTWPSEGRRELLCQLGLYTRLSTTGLLDASALKL